MNEEEIEKLIEELYKKRFSHVARQCTVKPSSSVSINASKPVSGINMDFASLYPSVQRSYFRSKKSRRKSKIEKIFN